MMMRSIFVFKTMMLAEPWNRDVSVYIIVYTYVESVQAQYPFAQERPTPSGAKACSLAICCAV